ncbi:hypothetical protein C0Q70_03481 [Pomacea canaliculata]|uniref:C1q domain-containing protein n=2 Tax=Pomacea canaliculata TaxID=400727 RepID=A0A2T7PSY8_POMCA|nr:hypothetical protein C0Q70_03481 [Pomacea canaliculata]
MRLKAVPQTVINGTTETLEITCRPPPVDEVVNLIVLLHLEKADETSAERLVSQRGFDTVLHVTDNRTSAEGQLQGEGGAFLSLKIISPVEEDTGIYQCRFVYLSLQTFEVKFVNKNISVAFAEPDEEVPASLPEISDECSCDDVWVEVKNLRDTLITENRELKQQLRSYDDSCRVSFSAQFGSRTGNKFFSNGIIRFDTAVSNKGNAYDITNGAFIAPCDGQYFFQLTLNTNQQGDSGYVDGVIEVNNTGKARTSVFTQDLSAHHEQATTGVVVTLKKNDAVQARIQTNSAGEIYGQVWSVFSGFYISP